MKRLIFIFFILGITLSLFAQEHGNQAGVGISIGEVQGITFKYWFDYWNAIDCVLSFVDRTEIYLKMDFLKHDFRLLKKHEEGKISVIYGIGFMAISNGTSGIRGVCGSSFFTKDYPMELFIDIAPVFALGNRTGMHFSGSIGVRYYFNLMKE